MKNTKKSPLSFRTQALLLSGSIGICSVSFVFVQSPKVDVCKTDLQGAIVPDRTETGTLVALTDKYLIQSRDGKSYALIPTPYPAPRPADYADAQRKLRLIETLQQHANELAEIQICGSTVIRVKASGNVVFFQKPKSQHDTDAIYSARARSLRILCIGAWIVFIFFLLVRL
jgi:hypothetical protein